MKEQKTMPKGNLQSKIFTVIIISVGLLVFPVFLVMQSTSRTTPPIIEGASPDNRYIVRVYGEKGEGLLNVPVYITVYGDTVDSTTHLGKLCKISTKIDNNNGGAAAESNVWLFWESNSKAIVVLMGKEQIPEVIKITFAKEAEVTRVRSSEVAKEILQGFQVDVTNIPSQYW